jgi:hypothetical protein
MYMVGILAYTLVGHSTSHCTTSGASYETQYDAHLRPKSSSSSLRDDDEDEADDKEEHKEEEDEKNHTAAKEQARNMHMNR